MPHLYGIRERTYYMKHFSILLYLVSCCLMVTSFNSNATSKEQLNALINASNKENTAYDVVSSLTLEVGPRIAGSQGDKRAVVWAENTFKELGFDKVYKQPVRVRNWSRGLSEAYIQTPYQQKLVVTALGGSVATPEGGLTAQVIMFDSLDDLRQASAEQVAGKIVFINKKMQRHKAGKGYGPVVSGRSQGAIEAAKLNALAVIIRSVGTSSARFAHTGAMKYSPDIPKIPAGAISNPDADTLAAIIVKGHNVTLALDMQAKEHGWQTSYNVIGEITGTESPEEIVLIAAHLDSWDEGTGALDDGAGVGIVMGAAHQIKKHLGNSKRTIRVILYANEEFGLIGAKQYVRDNRDDLKNIIVAAESDFGAGRIYRLDTRFAESALPFAKNLATALAPLNVELGNNAATGGPDISMLPKLGVPVVSLRQDGTHYFDYHHTPNDTLDKIEPATILQNQTVYAVFTYLMANSEVDPRPAPALN